MPLSLLCRAALSDLRSGASMPLPSVAARSVTCLLLPTIFSARALLFVSYFFAPAPSLLRIARAIAHAVSTGLSHTC